MHMKIYYWCKIYTRLKLTRSNRSEKLTL